MDADDGGAYLTRGCSMSRGMEVMREKLDPVVGVKVSGDDEAVALMNDRYGLTASLWTPDVDRAAQPGDRIETGFVFLNRADYLDPAVLDRGQGHRPWRRAVGDRLSQSDPPEIYRLKKVTSRHLPEPGLSDGHRFGAGRVAELGEACATAESADAAGHGSRPC